MPGRDRDADRASAQLVGFVLVVSLVLASVAVVTAVGYGELRDAHETRRTTNAERAFGVFADNVDDLIAGAPSRATEMHLGGAQLGFGDPVTVEVAGHPVGDPSDSFSHAYDLRPVVYDAGDTRIAYATGAVVRDDRGSAATLRRSPVRFDGDEVVVPVVVTRPRDAGAIGGSSGVLVRAAVENRTVRQATGDGGGVEVTVTVTSPRADAWYRSLDATDANCDPPSGDSVTCRATADRVVVTVTDVGVTFS